MRIERINQQTFGRKPNAREMQVYTLSVEKGLKLLNKEIDVIIHNASLPSAKAENTGIGSLFSRTTVEKLIPFLKKHSIKGIQIEPATMRKSNDFSPYAPESSAMNIFMIPLEKLASGDYRNLLSKETFETIVANRTKSNNTDYKKVSESYNKALKEVYENFKKGDFLKLDFEEFKAQKGDYLERAAIFRILDNKYKTGWTEWEGIDKKLFSPQTSEEAAASKARIEELKTKYADEINFFKFNQFILDRENSVFKKEAEKAGIRIIGDSPVASPAADEWINQNLYMKGVALGCPPDYFAKGGQRWGFRYFDPEKIFNPDGTLGEAGKIMKQKYEDSFANFSGGLRIDHVIGLVDPFIYTTSEEMTSRNSGRIYSLFTGKYKKTEEEYSNILEKIVLAAAKKLGIKKTDIICEDLGDPNKPTQDVMKKLGLGGVAVTQFGYRGATTPAKNVIMIGSHDNKSFLEHVDDVFETKNIGKKEKAEFVEKTTTLARDILPKTASEKAVKTKAKELQNDKLQYISARFAELFTSPAKRVQIFFTDFWGIPKTYNRPGTSKGNWSLRMSPNFERDYYKAVSEGKALNLPSAIATALRQRGLDKENSELIKNLDESAKILAE